MAAPPAADRSYWKLNGLRPSFRSVLLTTALLLWGCASDVTWTHDSRAVRQLPPSSAAFLYVALGDSTVEGVGATSPDRNYVALLYERLRAVYPRARVVNLGAGGATAAGVLSRCDVAL